jgi:hypothetical protein
MCPSIPISTWMQGCRQSGPTALSSIPSVCRAFVPSLCPCDSRYPPGKAAVTTAGAFLVEAALPP